MKYAVSLFTFLVLLISGLLFFQYHVSSNKLELGEGEFTYTQEIEITYQNDHLDIQQHFKNLPNQSIEIQWPIKAINKDCYSEDKTSCERLNDNKTTFNKGSNQDQSLSYIIPLEDGLKTNQLLKDVFVTLHNGQVTYSTVHITMDKDMPGGWITGLPLIGQQSLTHVSYFMFSGTGPVTELYYHSGDIKLQEENEAFSIYSKDPISEDTLKALNEISVSQKNHVAVIQSDYDSGEQGKRILFVQNFTLQSLQKNILQSQVESEFDFEGSPSWLSEVVTSLLMNTKIGSEKATEIVETLNNQMSDSLMDKWIDKLKEYKGKQLTVKILDETLSEVLNKQTNYFSNNAETEDIYPLLFNDNRELYINHHVVQDVDVVLKDYLVYYAAKPLFTHLGYNTSIGENGLYVNNGARSFRFPINYGFYVYNEKRFNTTSEPIVILGEQYYIEETWLQKLFDVEITKKDDEILINQSTSIQ